MIKKIGLFVTFLVLAITVSGCSGLLQVSSVEEYLINENVSAIDLSSYNGGIRWIPIRTGEPSKIEIEKGVRGTSIRAMEEYLETLCIEDFSTNSEIVLRVVQPSRPWGVSSSSVNFTVYASPEQITRFNVETSNGTIEIQANFHGYLNLRTSNGAIILRSGEGNVNIRTSNGRIAFDRIILTDSSSFKTSNGRIEGGVVLPSSGDILFETSNGQIDLKMPGNTTGTFDLKTSNGTVQFRLGDDNIVGKGNLYVKRGQQPFVDIRTSNGSINVLEDVY